MRPRRIAVVTGTRAEYGLLRSTLHALAADPGVELQLIVTGIHLLRRFGYTVDQIAADGWAIAARVPMQQGRDDALDPARGLARGVDGIARFLTRAESDIVVVLGDRIEALAGALAAVTTGRLLAHIHGGDVAPGDFDESFRHAITKLAHVHLAATRSAANRIVRLGEERRRVFVVGAPGLDRLRQMLRCSGRKPCRTRCSPRAVCDPLETRPYALVVQHAYGRAAAVEERTARAVLEAVAAAGLRRLVIYPNTDRGHGGVIAAIKHHARRSPRGEVEVLRSLPRDEYLRALIHARVLVGNSSSGVIEAPLSGTAALNVWQRQAGREPGGPCVIHTGESPEALARGLRRALAMQVKPGGRTVYGDGRAALIHARVLVGNSSSGVIEAPLAGTAALNVGQRQAGREPGGPCVIHTGESPEALARGLRRALAMQVKPGGRTVYGDGRAGARIAAILARLTAHPDFLRKRITY